MNNELHNTEVNEINKTDTENYKNIKPQREMSTKEVSDFWNNEFRNAQNQTDGVEDNTRTDIYENRSNEGQETTDRGKELTQEQKDDLLSKGMSPSLVNECKVDKDVYVIKTQNENLVDSKHPDTGVPYNKKIIDLSGVKVEGVFAEFDSIFSTKLPENKYLASDKVQFDYCNQQLKNAIKENPSLKEKFSERQLEQISVGQKPSGFTWNHNEELGKMELVDTNKHSTTPHTGGKAVWGGGSAYR